MADTETVETQLVGERRSGGGNDRWAGAPKVADERIGHR